MKTLALAALSLCLFVAVGCAEGNAPSPETQAVVTEAKNKVSANVSGMDCTGCSSSIASAVEGVDGVTACVVDLKTGDVNVALADDADAEAAKIDIESAITALSDGKFTVNTIAVSTAETDADADDASNDKADAPADTGSGY
ncbi:MAG: heavy-metal-associated domain-containing protein [Phycisphaeraceae bacterium]